MLLAAEGEEGDTMHLVEFCIAKALGVVSSVKAGRRPAYSGTLKAEFRSLQQMCTLTDCG